MSAQFDAARTAALSAELLPNNGMRTGFAPSGRFGASRYREGVGLVLTAERPEPVVSARPSVLDERPAVVEKRVRHGRGKNGRGLGAERRAKAAFYGATGPPPTPTSPPPVHVDQESVR